jgi:hypothetical protein
VTGAVLAPAEASADAQSLPTGLHLPGLVRMDGNNAFKLYIERSAAGLRPS